jgi:myosin heavy subunit
VLVTGESGAGKTESAKHLMRFVTAVYVMHAPSLRNS